MNKHNTYEQCITACNVFYKFATEMNDDKADSYARFIASFFKISDTHPRYKEAENRIIEILSTPEGQYGFSIAFPIFAHGVEEGHDIQQKLNTFLPYLHGKIKKEMMGWLSPEYAREWINDPDPAIQSIVSRTLGIEPDIEYEKIWKDKEIKDTVDNNRSKQTQSPTSEDKTKLNDLIKDFDNRFGDKNTKLNSADIEHILLSAKIFAKQVCADDVLSGGLADRKSVKDFDPEQLEKGIKEEMSEHTNSRQVATEIVMDHLTKDPNYYKND